MPPSKKSYLFTLSIRYIISNIFSCLLFTSALPFICNLNFYLKETKISYLQGSPQMSVESPLLGAKSRIWEVKPSLPHEWQGSNQLSVPSCISRKGIRIGASTQTKTWKQASQVPYLTAVPNTCHLFHFLNLSFDGRFNVVHFISLFCFGYSFLYLFKKYLPTSSTQRYFTVVPPLFFTYRLEFTFVNCGKLGS